MNHYNCCVCNKPTGEERGSGYVMPLCDDCQRDRAPEWTGFEAIEYFDEVHEAESAIRIAGRGHLFVCDEADGNGQAKVVWRQGSAAYGDY